MHNTTCALNTRARTHTLPPLLPAPTCWDIQRLQEAAQLLHRPTVQQLEHADADGTALRLRAEALRRQHLKQALQCAGVCCQLVAQRAQLRNAL